MSTGKITITVSGEAMSGKSIMTFLLKKFLKENNFNVNHEVGLDFASETEFDRHMLEKTDMNSISSKEIVLNEVQLARNSE